MRLRTLAATAAAAALIPALAACGSNDSKPAATVSASTTSSTTVTPTGTPTLSAAAKSGLHEMVHLAEKIAATKDVAAAKALADGLEGFWSPIEDGVKDKSADAYVAIEDAMAILESGDPAKTPGAARDLAATVGGLNGAPASANAHRTAELTKLAALGKQIAAGKADAAGLETIWKPIEDGIKDVDQDTYIAIEDAFADLESGDSAKMVKGAADLDAAISAFVQAHP